MHCVPHWNLKGGNDGCAAAYAMVTLGQNKDVSCNNALTTTTRQTSPNRLQRCSPAGRQLPEVPKDIAKQAAQMGRHCHSFSMPAQLLFIQQCGAQ